MRCSDCSRPVQPVVALDIDGTLGDYHGHFERFAQTWLGHGRFGRGSEEDDYDGSVRYRDWFAEAYNISVETFRQIKLAYRQGGMKRSMPCCPNARTLTDRLHGADAEVWLVTTRPYLKHDAIDPDTREWTERNGIQWDHLLYGPEKYKRLIEQVDPERIVAILDDQVDQLREANTLGLGRVTILKRTRFNRAVQFSPSVTGLHEASDRIAGQLQRWYEQIGALA